MYALYQLVSNGGNDPANRDKWLWRLRREKECLVGMWLPTLNAIRPPVAGECGTAIFLGEDYLTKRTDEETRVNVNIGRMPSYPNVTSVPLDKIYMGWAGPLPFVDEQNDHGLGLNGSKPGFSS